MTPVRVPYRLELLVRSTFNFVIFDVEVALQYDYDKKRLPRRGKIPRRKLEYRHYWPS